MHIWVSVCPAQATLGSLTTISSNNMVRLCTWTSLDGQYQNQIDYILCSQRWSSIQSANARPGVDCGSDHELLIAKFRPKLKKVGHSGMTYIKSPTITVEVTNTFNRLDLIDRVPDELWTDVHDILPVRETGIKTIPKKKKCKKTKDCLSRPYK